MKVFIYDFDGTLTPYAYPRYKILNKCGINPKEMLVLANKYMDDNNTDMYSSYLAVFNKILQDNNYEITIDNICDGADDIEYNKGVIDYFKKYKNYNIKHYIISSGFSEYIRRTIINKYITDVYGTDFNKIITDKDKENAIKSIVLENNVKLSDVIYFGDGLTDIPAFEYVNRNGGKSIMLIDSFEEKNYIKLKELNIIDKFFVRDYSNGSELDKYISNLIKNKNS